MTRLTFGIALALTAAPALADPSSIAVPYGDLDLRSTAGVTTLDKRLSAASRRVCGKPSTNAIERLGQRRCRMATRASVNGRRDTVIAAANSAGVLATR